MRKITQFLSIIIILTSLFSTTMAFAHHAFTAQYDIDKPADLQGVVIKVDWLNPHAYFYIDVTDEETGDVTTWSCELGSPVSLLRQGWNRNSITLGQTLNVQGSLARDGSASLNARSVVIESTGERLFSRQQN